MLRHHNCLLLLLLFILLFIIIIIIEHHKNTAEPDMNNLPSLVTSAQKQQNKPKKTYVYQLGLCINVLKFSHDIDVNGYCYCLNDDLNI